MPNKDFDSVEIYANMIEKMEDEMIKASNKAGITSHQLLDILVQQGVTGVYNLGLKHMYEYLKGNSDEKTV